MSSKILVILASLVLLYSFGIHEALPQGQPPPLVPPLVGYGMAYVDDVALDADHVSIRMDLLLVVFLDGSGDQTRIGSISSELQAASASGDVVSLPNLQLAFAESSNPPTSLSGNTSVADVEPLTSEWTVIGCWQVNDWDNSNTYTLQIIEPVAGKEVLEVYQHNGVLASCNTTSSYLAYDCNYVMEIPLYSDEVRGDGNYVVREAGKATTSSPFDRGYAYVNDIRANKIDIYDGDTPVPVIPAHVPIEDTDVMKMDIFAPSEYEFILDLEKGWNWISFPISKCFYQGTPPSDQPDCVEPININQLGCNTMAEWFTDILSPGDAWQVVMGELGSMNVDVDSSRHSLRFMSPCSGYRVKVKEAATLRLTGPLFDPSCFIHLSKGWNWIGLPLIKVYYDTSSPPSIDVPEDITWVRVDAPVAEYVFDWIAGEYHFVMGELGSYNRDRPDRSSLHYMAPGRAYRIRMDEERDLKYR